MGLNLWWVRNDGIGGHVWLSVHDLRLLTDEMLVQGIAWPRDRLAAAEGGEVLIGAPEVEQALKGASVETKTLADRKLWEDWLAFLEGAAENGGLLIRA